MQRLVRMNCKEVPVPCGEGCVGERWDVCSGSAYFICYSVGTSHITGVVTV